VKFYLVCLLILLGLKCYGQHETSPTTGPLIDSSKNNFLNTQHNKSWTSFKRKIQKLHVDPSAKVIIVHAGDSHIQGGYFTNRIRTLLNSEYGVSGRGFIFPYSLVNTNGPEDVRFTHSKEWTGQKYSFKPGEEKTGIAGYTLWMNNSHADLDAYLRQGSDSLYPYNEIVIFHNCPVMHIWSKPEADSNVMNKNDHLYATKLTYKGRPDTIHLHVSAGDSTKQRPAIYGLELLNIKGGIVYHAIGANGGTFESYSRAIDYLPVLKLQQPDCVIISLGTNDAFMRYIDTVQLKSRILSMIDNIKKELPEVCIILTTPGDHLRDKKFPNPNLLKVRSTIISCAIEKSCVYWDFFAVMGGLYASKKWQKNGLMYKDVIHLSKEGYKLEGELFFEAFRKAINTKTEYGN
jgi:lysophospholipase L1-like esterase